MRFICALLLLSSLIAVAYGHPQGVPVDLQSVQVVESVPLQPVQTIVLETSGDNGGLDVDFQPFSRKTQFGLPSIGNGAADIVKIVADAAAGILRTAGNVVKK
ncbi:hypothetical protein C0J52_04325 [Blattella germanica]|nr:hypothetical protein C0J52_04325 [Blattella germanica]